MASEHKKRVTVARRVRRIIQERQDSENWARDWEEVPEIYNEKYHQPIEKGAGFTTGGFMAWARGQLARDLNRYVGDSLKNFTKGRTKSSPFNPVYKVNGGLVDIMHAYRKAKSPEDFRQLSHTLEKKYPTLVEQATMMTAKVEWYEGVMNAAKDKAGEARVPLLDLPRRSDPLLIEEEVKAIAAAMPEDEPEVDTDDDDLEDDEEIDDDE